jgi:hypothetical protein
MPGCIKTLTSSMNGGSVNTAIKRQLYRVNEANISTRLVLELPQFDEEFMVIELCKYVNGTTILPKFPVYL